ncbi:Chitin synthase, class 7, variant 2 [Entomophthora muscae]|nr:Chitin synthase, class 7, variant 2 [Entomophthora muscae]
MTAVMIRSTRNKSCAVGKDEMILFFYLFLSYIFMELLTTVVPMASFVYPLVVGLHFALGVTAAWTLMLTGIIGYQQLFPGMLNIDPTGEDIDGASAFASLAVHGLSLGVFIGSLVVSLATFANKAGLDHTAPRALFTIHFVIIPCMLLAYGILRVGLLVQQEDSRWAVGDLCIAGLFFCLGQLIFFSASSDICASSKHYLDGSFFSQILLLLSVMMIYKSWDSSNNDCFEFEINAVPLLIFPMNLPPLKESGAARPIRGQPSSFASWHQLQ